MAVYLVTLSRSDFEVVEDTMMMWHCFLNDSGIFKKPSRKSNPSSSGILRSRKITKGRLADVVSIALR